MRSAAMTLVLAVTLGAMAACGGGGAKEPTPTPVSPTSTTIAPATGTPVAEGTVAVPATVELAPADAQSPASGVCPAPPAGDVVTWRISEGIPSPRCNQIRPDQTVAFIDDTVETIEIRLGAYTITVASGATGEIGQPVGTYLAPGVHVAHTSTYGGQSGPEVWVVIPSGTPAP